MKVSTFTYKDKNGAEIFVRKWSPENFKTKATLQIIHGMAEHSGRYNEFAEFLTEEGFVVYANDHKGHGETGKNSNSLGYFAPQNGWLQVLDDVFELSKIIKSENPDKKHFMLGHSMGSFILRSVIAIENGIADGAIVSGTGFKRGFEVSFGKTLAKFHGLLFGKSNPSMFLTKMAFKDFNKKFEPRKTAFDWLSRDYDKNIAYKEDPFCGIIMSNRFFVDVLSLVGFANSEKNMKKVAKDLPMFFVSGTMDPVGDYGKGVEEIYNKYKDLGIKDIKLKLYDEGRHEMLNEINRQEVFEEILLWLEQKL